MDWRVLRIFLFSSAALFIIDFHLKIPLWIDEFTSIWVVEGTFLECLSRSINYQGQSPLYYSILWLVKELFGTDKFALRSLSIVTGGLSVVYFCLLVQLICGRKKDFFAGVLYILALYPSGVFIYCRPYCLAMLCFSASLYYLTDHLINGSQRAIVAYIASTALCLYSHYMFLPVLILHAAFVVSFKGVQGLRQIFFYWVFVGVALLPSVFQVRILVEKKLEYTFEKSADLSEYFISLAPVELWAFLAAVTAVAILSRKYSFDRCEIRGQLYLFWILVGPTFFLILDKLFGFRHFLVRYWPWQFLGIVMLVLAYEECLSRSFRKCLRGFYFILLFTFLPGKRYFPHEDWEKLIKDAIQRPDYESELHFIYPGLIEANSANWINDHERLRYMGIPYRYFVGEDATDVVPGVFDNKLAQIWNARNQHRLSMGNTAVVFIRVVFNGNESAVEIVKKYFAEHAYKTQESLCDGGICVLLFRKVSEQG